MEINQILCKKSKKILKSDKIFKVKNYDDGCIEEVVTYCTLCPYSENKKEVCPSCKSCYGTIAQSKKTFKIKGSNKNMVQIENYRNKFEIDEFGEYIRSMNADDFMQIIDKIANLNTLNWNHGQKIYDKLRAYDKPKAWKTDCLECRKECLKSGTETICRQAGIYLENKFGVSVKYMSQEQLLSDIPNEYICQNQAQTMYFV